MRVLNFGSLNIDYIYRVGHIAAPGETLAAASREVFCGGKGLNQSIALAKAGAEVYHAGCIGEEGYMLQDALEEAGVDCCCVKTIKGPSGHAIIQVEESGENSILLFGGANQMITSDFVDEVLDGFENGDILLLQNEINLLGQIVDKAHSRGMKIVMNPSPFNEQLKEVDLGKVSMLILNEVEGQQITGKSETETVLEKLTSLYPDTEIVLTLGEEGSVYQYKDIQHYQPAYPVTAVDTTGAGDTFTGYFLAALMDDREIPACLDLAAKASSIAVTRKGAAPSIPCRHEVEI